MPFVLEGQKTALLDTDVEQIIIPLVLRWCWNWQTGMVEGHVPQGVWVQLPPSAQEISRFPAAEPFNGLVGRGAPWQNSLLLNGWTF